MKKANNRKRIKKSASKTQTKSRTMNSSSDKTVQSVENGIAVLKYAIKNNMSVSKAAVKNKKGRNYVSDIKARIENNYKNRSISRDLYNTFKSFSKNYDKKTQR